MNLPYWLTIGGSVVSDFVISAGGAYLAATAATGNSIPSAGVVIAAIITGAVQAARGLQKLLSPPPR